MAYALSPTVWIVRGGDPGSEQIGHFSCQLWLSRPLRVGLAGTRVLGAPGAPEPKQDRQADRPLKARQSHDDPDHDEVVAPRAGVRLAVRGRVVMPVRAMDLATETVQQRVIDRDQHRRPRRAEPLDDQLGDPQPELID